jgi:Trypsin-like peptidase domain
MRTQIALCVGSGVLGAALMTWILEGPSPLGHAAAGQDPGGEIVAAPKAGFVSADRSHPAPDQLAQGPQIPQSRRTEAAEPSTPERIPAEPAAGNRPADPPPLAIGRTSLTGDDYTAEERVNISVYENCNRSVVNISTKVVNQNLMLFESTEEGAGSGSVLDKQGHILTNYHVVEGAREIEVTLFDGKSYDGRLVGRDPQSDVAVLRINAPAESLFPIRLGDSGHLKVGQRVFALGNPFGLERTLTTGIVSSLNRSLPSRNNRTIKSIARQPRPPHRHELRHRQPNRAEQRRGLCNPGRHDRPSRAAAHSARARHTPRHRHHTRLSERARSTGCHNDSGRTCRASRTPRHPRRATEKAARTICLRNRNRRSQRRRPHCGRRRPTSHKRR